MKFSPVFLSCLHKRYRNVRSITAALIRRTWNARKSCDSKETLNTGVLIGVVTDPVYNYTRRIW